MTLLLYLSVCLTKKLVVFCFIPCCYVADVVPLRAKKTLNQFRETCISAAVVFTRLPAFILYIADVKSSHKL